MNDLSTPEELSVKAFGLILLLSVVFIWVSSGLLIQFIYNDAPEPEPIFLTYYSTVLFSVLLVPAYFEHQGHCQRWFSSEEEPQRHMPLASEERDLPEAPSLFDDGYGELESEERMTPQETFILSAKFSAIWFGANVLYNASLSCTSISSTNILSSTSGVFTLIVSRFILNDSISVQKAVAVVCCFAGVVVVATSDASGSNTVGPCNNPSLGDALSLGSAIAYAMYTVLLKKMVGSEKRVSMLLFFGLIGVINAVAVVPVLFVAHITAVETFRWPSSRELGLLTLNGIVGTVLSDYLWARSVLLLTPLISTLGLSLTIPASMLAQALLFNDQFSPGFILGAGLAFAGFIMVNLESSGYDVHPMDVIPDAVLLVPASPQSISGDMEDLDGLMKAALDDFDDFEGSPSSGSLAQSHNNYNSCNPESPSTPPESERRRGSVEMAYIHQEYAPL